MKTKVLIQIKIQSPNGHMLITPYPATSRDPFRRCLPLSANSKSIIFSKRHYAFNANKANEVNKAKAIPLICVLAATLKWLFH